MIVRTSPSGPVAIPAVLIESLGWLAGSGNNLAVEILPVDHAPGLYMVSHSYTWRVDNNSISDFNVGLTWSSGGVAQSASPVVQSYGSQGTTRITSGTAQRPATQPGVVDQNYTRAPIILLSDGSAPIVLTASFSTALDSPGIDFYASVLQVG